MVLLKSFISYFVPIIMPFICLLLFTFPQGAHEKVSAGSALTKFQLLILLLSFVIRHHLSDSGLGDLLKILNLIQLDCVPKTKYRFYANFKTTKETLAANGTKSFKKETSNPSPKQSRGPPWSSKQPGPPRQWPLTMRKD